MKAKELWEHIAVRNEIMSIAEDIAPFFKSRKSGDDGEIARFISVKNIEFSCETIGEASQFNTQIEFLSDVGSWFEEIIIRQFTSKFHFEQELDCHWKVEQRCFLIPYAQPIDILQVDETNLRIIYEQSPGIPLKKIRLSSELLDFQLGMLCAQLQGGSFQLLPKENIVSMQKYLMEILPFNKQEMKALDNLILPHYELIKDSLGGYEAASLFDPASFRLIPKEPLNKITKSMISQNQAFEIDIIPIQVQDQITDRMADIAMLYAEQAWLEFKATKTVDKTRDRIIHFLEGYELAFSNVATFSFEEMYPKGLTLDLQMILIYWLLIHYLLHDETEESAQQIKQEMINYSYFVLLNNPFQMFSTKFSYAENEN